MDFGYLKNVSVEDAIAYMAKMGYTVNVHAQKRSDDVGPYMKMLGSKQEGKELDTFRVDMGEFLPRVYRENVVVKVTPLGNIKANFWDNDMSEMCKKDENGELYVPEYIKEWWTLVASKNPDQTGYYLDRISGAFATKSGSTYEMINCVDNVIRDILLKVVRMQNESDSSEML